MRRHVGLLLLALVLAALVFAPYLMAQMVCYSAGLKTASESVLTGKGSLCGIEIITDGTNDASATVYDETSASGTVLYRGTIRGSSQFGGVTFNPPVRYTTGIYVLFYGTGASYIVHYSGY